MLGMDMFGLVMWRDLKSVQHDGRKCFTDLSSLLLSTSYKCSVECSNVFFSKCSVVFAVSNGYFIFMLGKVMFGLVMW